MTPRLRRRQRRAIRKFPHSRKRANRLELAEHEWARLKAKDSLECRNSHNYQFMDWTRQGDRAVHVHSTALEGGQYTCIDCHKGIAHTLPDMEGIEMLYGAPPEKIDAE